MLIKERDLVNLRESYDYVSDKVNFDIHRTSRIHNVIVVNGIYPRNATDKGINLRQFEIIVQNVFNDIVESGIKEISVDQDYNLKSVIKAIVYWKMSSQGGRANRCVGNVCDKWNDNTSRLLIEGYLERDLSKLKIGGVRIPTASAIMRFLYPNEFGVIDSRVTKNYTEPNGITSLSIRNDGYINDTKGNVEKYYSQYIEYLRGVAMEMNRKGIRFKDIDENGLEIQSEFRVCDVEMALFKL